MKYGTEDTGVSKTQKNSDKEVTDEDIACQFLQRQGYHSPQPHSA
jgi:hypothetical protein